MRNPPHHIPIQWRSSESAMTMSVIKKTFFLINFRKKFLTIFLFLLLFFRSYKWWPWDAAFPMGKARLNFTIFNKLESLDEFPDIKKSFEAFR